MSVKTVILTSSIDMAKATYPFRLSDGGCHSSSTPYEVNDCTVMALALVTQLKYDQVHEVLKKAGRRTNQGFESDLWLKRRGGAAFGGVFKAIPIKGLTVHTFHLSYPKGRFLIETDYHVGAVINGVHYDTTRVKEQPLTGCWQWFPGKGLDVCARM